jgi:hypothetical protein
MSAAATGLLIDMITGGDPPAATRLDYRMMTRGSPRHCWGEGMTDPLGRREILGA